MSPLEWSTGTKHDSKDQKRGDRAWNSWWSAFLLAILTGNRLVGGRDPSNHENKSKSNDKSIPYYNSFDISSFSLFPSLFRLVLCQLRRLFPTYANFRYSLFLSQTWPLVSNGQLHRLDRSRDCSSCFLTLSVERRGVARHSESILVRCTLF